MISPQKVVRKISDNFFSIKWWRRRVFVPYVLGTASRFHPRYPGYDESIHVMEEDWDTLIVLDSCRADLFSDMVDVDQFDEYSSVVSLGSHSSEWTRRNFTGKTFSDTVYVSANPHTTLLANDTFHEIIEMWNEAETKPNEMDPAKMIQAAVEANEQYPNKRLIVHFMQPHGTGGLIERQSSWEQTHRKTIAAMMEYVFDLHEQVGGKSVVTADHGQLFHGGLRAKLGLTGHRARLRIPELVYVPWAVIDGDRRSVVSGSTSKTETDDETIKNRLRDLGYVN